MPRQEALRRVMRPGAEDTPQTQQSMWTDSLQQDLHTLLDQRVRNIERTRATNPQADLQLARVQDLRTNGPLEMQLVSVMNNFSHYLPNFGGNEVGKRETLAQLEEEAEDDPQLMEQIRIQKRVFDAVDTAITELHISYEDIQKMREAKQMDKQDPEYKRIIHLMADLFYHLRATGFSIRELTT